MAMMQEANKAGTVDGLRELAAILAKSIDDCVDEKNLPGLARQYRETVKELRELDDNVDDDISQIVEGCDAIR